MECRQQSVPSSLAVAGGRGALIQVCADVARHGAQVICKFAQRGQTGLLGEGGTGLGQNTEAFADDLPGGLTVGQYEVVRPGRDGPIGSVVRTGQSRRITQFIKCFAVRASVSSSAGVSPW